MPGLNFAIIANQKLAATESKSGPKKMKKEKGQKTASKKTFKLNFPGEKSVGKAGGEKWKSMSETEKSPHLEKASERKAEYQTVLQENKKKNQGPVVRTSGASSSTMVSIGMLVVLLLSSLPEHVQSYSASCSNELDGFTPCLPFAYAAPNNRDDSPTLDCCNAFIAAVESGDDICFCTLIKDPNTLGVPVNQTRVLLLSSLCHTTIHTELKNTCGGIRKIPPMIFIPDSGLEEHSLEAKKGSFFSAFCVLIAIGILRILLVIIF